MSVLSRSAAAFLFIALALDLAGCSHVPDEGPVTITYFCFQQSPVEAIEPLARAFMEEHPGVMIRLVPYYDVLRENPGYITADMIRRIARATDTFAWFSDGIQYPLAPEGVVLPLEPLMDAAGRQALDDFPPAALDLFRRDGKLYGLPQVINPMVVYYDPAAFDETGLPYPHIGWTWDEFLQDAVTLTVRDGERVTRYGFADPFAAFTMAALAGQRVDRLVDAAKEPPELHLDDPGVGEALAWYTALWRDYGAMPEPSEGRTVVDLRRAAMWIDQALDWPENSARGLEVAALPENGRASGALFASGYYVSAGCAHPEAAWQWIEYLSRQTLPKQATWVMPPRKAAHWLQWDAVDAESKQVMEYVVAHAQAFDGGVLDGLLAAYAAYAGGSAMSEALATGQSTGQQELAQEAGLAAGEVTPVPVPTVTPVPTVAADAVRFRLLSPTDRLAYEAIVARYAAANPGEHVSLVIPSAGTNWSSLADLDCFVYPASRLETEGAAGLLPLDSFIEADGADLSGFAPGALAAVQTDGHMWGLPLGDDPQLLYYNKATFDAAGLAYPTADWTVDDFVAAAMALSDPGAPTYGFYPRDGAYRHVAAYLSWFRASLHDRDGMPTFDDPSVAAALARYSDLVQRAMPPEAVAGGNTFGDNASVYGLQPSPVAEGNVAMWLDTPYNQAHSPRLDFEMGVVTTPRSATPIQGIGYRALFVSAGAQDPGACWRFISFVAKQPEATSLLPASVAVARGDAWAEMVGEETAAAWRTLIERGAAPAAEDPVTGPAAYWVGEALMAVLGGAAPEQVLVDAQTHAAAYAACMLDMDEATRWDAATQQACARRADPQVRLAAAH
jgi:ABC-type glycerol-3-phosphate transport system substrate-binding protein